MENLVELMRFTLSSSFLNEPGIPYYTERKALRVCIFIIHTC